MTFPIYCTLLKGKKMVPQVEDDLIDQMLEIKPTEKGSNHVLYALWKWLDIMA